MIADKISSEGIISGVIVTVVGGVILFFITNPFQKNASESPSSQKDTITIQQNYNAPEQPHIIEKHYYSTESKVSEPSNSLNSSETRNVEPLKEVRETPRNEENHLPECQTNKTGTFVFKNNTQYSLFITISYQKGYTRFVRLALPPGIEKNTGDLPVGFVDYDIENEDVKDEWGNKTHGDYGKIQIEQCKTGRYDISKIVVPKQAPQQERKGAILP